MLGRGGIGIGALVLDFEPFSVGNFAATFRGRKALNAAAAPLSTSRARSVLEGALDRLEGVIETEDDTVP
jgi:hypothetical protein